MSTISRKVASNKVRQGRNSGTIEPTPLSCLQCWLENLRLSCELALNHAKVLAYLLLVP